MSRYFSVKNFDKFQHYKDRNPPWIKLYNELLDDYAFGSLPDASKMHLVAIWLLASRSENKIPYDPEWVGKRINATCKVDLSLLERTGFIVVDQPLQKAVHDASTMIAECLSRVEGEESREEKKSSSGADAPRPAGEVKEKFEEFWRERPRRKGDDPRKPAEEKFYALVKTGADPDKIIAGVRKAAQIAKQNGKWGTEYLPHTVRWLRDQRFSDLLADDFDKPAADPAIDWDKTVERYSRGFQWNNAHYGPAPDQPGCRVPAEVLTKYGYGQQLRPLDVPSLQAM